jgi:tetratricopeptide (TPR) repeat protein
MATIWRGCWCMCMLLLVSCSSKQSAPALHASNPQAIEQLYQDGRVAFKERRYDEAAALFARVVAADSEHMKARLNWAAALSYSNKVSEAIVQCQNVLARDPTNAEAYYQWGAVLVRAGKHQEALEKFDQALALKPMTELLQDDPLLQQSLQAYLKRQRRQASDTDVVRPKPGTGHEEEERIPPGRATP